MGRDPEVPAPTRSNRRIVPELCALTTCSAVSLSIGCDLSDLAAWNVAAWAIAVTVAAIAAMTIGSYLVARPCGIDHRDSLAFGLTLSARGALEIVVATVGLTLGIIDATAFTIIVVMALVTTAPTALLLRRTIRARNAPA